jgi:hypothetical protein
MWKNLCMLWRTLKKQEKENGDLGSGTAAKNERNQEQRSSGRPAPLHAGSARDLLPQGN